MKIILLFTESQTGLFTSFLPSDKGKKVVIDKKKLIPENGYYEVTITDNINHYSVLESEKYEPLVEVTDLKNGHILMKTICGFTLDIDERRKREECHKYIESVTSSSIPTVRLLIGAKRMIEIFELFKKERLMLAKKGKSLESSNYLA